MITAVLIDDDKHLREGLKALLQRYTNEINIIGEAESVKSGVEILELLQPQVIFLDIHLSDGTGFDILEQLKGKTTAHCIYYSSRTICIKSF
jgi:two-component system LytT family response regulator